MQIGNAVGTVMGSGRIGMDAESAGAGFFAADGDVAFAVPLVPFVGFAEGNFAPLQMQIAAGIQLCGFGSQFAARRDGGIAFQAAYLRGGYGRRYAVLLQLGLGFTVTGHRHAVFQAAGEAGLFALVVFPILVAVVL